MEEQQQSAIIKLFKYPNKPRHTIANVQLDLDISKCVILCSMCITTVFSQTGRGYRMLLAITSIQKEGGGGGHQMNSPCKAQSLYSDEILVIM